MSWHIHINGLLIGDEQELREQIPADLLESPGNHNSLIAEILEAAESPRPTELINQWMEREPGVMSMLEFIQPPQAVPEPMNLAQRPLDAELSRIAATGLMSGYEDHVMFISEGGYMVINEENPPTLEQAGDITNRLFQISDAAKKLDEFGKWQRGSFLDSCENVYGENFSITQFIALTQEGYDVTNACLMVYRAFRHRRYEGLSWTHHKEAHYTNIPDDEERSMMHRILRLSQHYGLSCVQQRKLFSYARNFGEDNITTIEEATDFERVHEDLDEAIAAGDITTREDLMERITVRESNRNYLFKFQRSWYHWRGVREAIPNGATDVICTDDWREVRTNGNTAEIPAWSPIGVPAEEPT